jgi:hypothetical protein
MEIAQYLVDDAAKILQFEGDTDLPKQLAGTEFYVAKKED